MISSPLSFPWGTEDVFAQNEQVTVKLLHVKKGECFSLQYHHHREEFWKVLSGHPKVIIGEETYTGKPGDEFTVGREVKHRILAEHEDATVLEIARGDFDESDIVRLEDKYNRT